MLARKRGLSDAIKMILSMAASDDGVTYRQLADATGGRSRSTVERTLEAIRHAYGEIEELGEPGRAKRFRLRPTAFRKAVGTKAEEIVEVKSAAARLVKAGLHERGRILLELAAKLEANATSNLPADIQALVVAEGVAARPGPRVTLSDGLIDRLRRAILAFELIEIRYRPTGKEARWYVVEPYCLLYGDAPYLLAQRPEKMKPEIGVWRLDRILRVRTAGRMFQARPGHDIESLTRHNFGIWTEPPFDVVLRFSGPAVEEAEHWQFHQSQRPEKQGDCLVVRFHAGGLREMALHLVRFGGWLEVLEPDKLREELAELGRKLLARHGVGAA